MSSIGHLITSKELYDHYDIDSNELIISPVSCIGSVYENIYNDNPEQQHEYNNLLCILKFFCNLECPWDIRDNNLIVHLISEISGMNIDQNSRVLLYIIFCTLVTMSKTPDNLIYMSKWRTRYHYDT